MQIPFIENLSDFASQAKSYVQPAMKWCGHQVNWLGNQVVNSYEAAKPLVKTAGKLTIKALLTFKEYSINFLIKAQKSAFEYSIVAKELVVKYSYLAKDLTFKYGAVAIENGSKYGTLAIENGSKYGSLTKERLTVLIQSYPWTSVVVTAVLTSASLSKFFSEKNTEAEAV